MKSLSVVQFSIVLLFAQTSFAGWWVERACSPKQPGHTGVCTVGFNTNVGYHYKNLTWFEPGTDAEAAAQTLAEACTQECKAAQQEHPQVRCTWTPVDVCSGE